MSNTNKLRLLLGGLGFIIVIISFQMMAFTNFRIRYFLPLLIGFSVIVYALIIGRTEKYR